MLLFFSYQCKRLSRVALENVIKEVGKRANVIGKFFPFYAVRCLLNGVDLHSLARLLGHSDISINQRYKLDD